MLRNILLFSAFVIQLSYSNMLYGQGSPQHKDPVLVVYGKGVLPQTIYFDQLADLDSVGTSRPDFRIISFNVALKFNNDFMILRSYSPRFTPEQKAAFSNIANKGKLTDVIIEEIKAIGPDTIPRKLAPLNIKVIDEE